MTYEQNTHKSWLASCPSGDTNFKNHLGQASKEEIEELIVEMPEKGNVTKIKALKAELKRRSK